MYQPSMHSASQRSIAPLAAEVNATTRIVNAHDTKTAPQTEQNTAHRSTSVFSQSGSCKRKPTNAITPLRHHSFLG